jgi:hypothetical protein
MPSLVNTKPWSTAQGRPIGPVVPERFVRIDKVVPQALPRFGQPPIELLGDLGMSICVHPLSPCFKKRALAPG